MESYIRQEYKRDDIFLKELNLALINGFEHYLRTERTSQGVPIETVNRMMGHTNIKTTQIYAKITKEKISQDMEALSLKLEGLEKQITDRI